MLSPPDINTYHDYAPLAHFQNMAKLKIKIKEKQHKGKEKNGTKNSRNNEQMNNTLKTGFAW